MYSNRSKQAFESDIDWIGIDSSAKNNAAIREKQLAEMINILRHTGAFFDFVNAAKVEAIATRLQSNKIGVVSLRKASERIIQAFDKFPSYKAIYELCRTIRIDVYDPSLVAHKELMQKELKEEQEIRQRFYQVFGKENIKKFTTWWIKANYSIEPNITESFISSYMAFTKCAMFDWKDAGYPTKNFEEKMKQVFRSKKSKLLNKNLDNRILP